MPRSPHRLSVLAQTIDLIKDGIANDVWGRNLPQERQLSESINVSRSTIRRALAEIEALGLIEPGKRGKRRHITASRTRRSLFVGGKNARIIWLTHDESYQLPSFNKNVYIETQKRLAMNACDLNMVTLPFMPRVNPAKHLTRWVAQHRCDAYLLHSMPPAVQTWFSEHQRNACLLGNQAEGVKLSSVAVDVEASVRHALSMLHRLNHRRVLMLYRSVPRLVGEIQCRDTFLQGKALELSTEVLGLNDDSEELRRNIERIFCRPRSRQPTAIVCTLPYLALTTLTLLLKQRICVPEEVSIVLLRSQNLLRYANPTFAHYSVSEKRFAPLIVNRLLDIVRSGASNGKQVTFTPEFIPGESLGKNCQAYRCSA